MKAKAASSLRGGAASARLWLRAALLFAIAACSTNEEGGNTALVLGLESDPMGGALGSVHVTATASGQSLTDQRFVALNDPKAFPREIKLTAPVGMESAFVDVRIDGFIELAEAANNAPIITRIARIPFVRGQTRLARLRLDSRCISGAPISVPGPTCVEPLTCISGKCVDSRMIESDLEPYSERWASDAPDICRPANAGEAQVIVGTGQTDYLPLTEGQTLKLERGPQGGHHVWVAVRMRNLRQSGGTTTITGVQPETGYAAPNTSFVFNYERDEGGFCKLYGLRYQLDVEGNDYHPFLGKSLDVTVEIVDRAGIRSKGTTRIMIDSQVLCPPSIPDCAN